MKDDIKEILARLKNNDFERDCNNGSCYKELYLSEITTILDYITNLQEENERLKQRNKILAEDITKDSIKCDVIQTVCGIPIEEIPYLKDYKTAYENVITANKMLREENERLNNRIDKLNNIIKIMENYLKLIIDIGTDYDGCNTIDSLKSLIDELVKYAKLGRTYNTTEPIYGSNNKVYNIIHEELKECVK